MTTKVQITDLQFTGKDDTEKLRRLMDELRKLQRAVNTLIDEVTAAASPTTTVSSHVLATEAGLGSQHTVSGLVAGDVLVATAPTVAKFRKLQFSDLDQTDIGVPNNLDLIQFYNGYFSLRPPSSLLGVGDPGADALLSWNDTTNAYTWRLAGVGIGFNAGTIYVKPEDLTHGDLAGLSANDHPQYTRRVADETITGSWTFNAPVAVNGDLTLTGSLYTLNGIWSLVGAQPYVLWTDTGSAVDEGAWKWIVNPGMLSLYSLSDDGGEGELALNVTRIAELIDEWQFSGNALRFNGAQVVTDDDRDYPKVLAYSGI